MLLGLFKAIVAAFGVVLILIGIPLTPSPIPFGIVFIALGLSLLVWASPSAVRWLRRRWGWFDRQMRRLEQMLPDSLAKYLKKSDLDSDDDQVDDEDDSDAMEEEARRRYARR
ncbi:MAG: hypothetical protein AAGA22_09785 [Pseudomonadota bacterium]